MPKNIEVVAPCRSALDLVDPRAIARMIAAEPWNAVINAAAYTGVDRTESEQAMALAINAEAPSRLWQAKSQAAEFRSFIFRPIMCSTVARARPMAPIISPGRVKRPGLNSPPPSLNLQPIGSAANRRWSRSGRLIIRRLPPAPPIPGSVVLCGGYSGVWRQTTAVAAGAHDNARPDAIDADCTPPILTATAGTGQDSHVMAI